MSIIVNLRYTGKSGSARAFAEEMTSSGTVDVIRQEDGNLRYEYYLSFDDPETVLLIDEWTDQAAIDRHHASPMMQKIAELRDKYTEKIVQTAGREALGEFAPDFAHFNDDILFGENWNNTDIDLKTRSIITVVALMSQGVTDNSIRYHIQNAKNHGVSQREMAAVITHTAFYAGWPHAWAVFNIAKEVYAENAPAVSDKNKFQNEIIFPIGEPNPYGDYFVGQSYLAPVSTEQIPIYNVTFEPACRNNWHIHHAKSGGGQMLICIGGCGWYQESGKEPRELNPGDIVNIPAEIKHWHGAAKDSWFAHLAIEIQGEDSSTQWCEPVSDEEYGKLK